MSGLAQPPNPGRLLSGDEQRKAFEEAASLRRRVYELEALTKQMAEALEKIHSTQDDANHEPSSCVACIALATYRKAGGK